MTDDLGTFYEALLFIAERPLDTDELAKLGEVPRLQAEAALTSLAERLEEDGRGLRVQHHDGAWQLVTAPEVGARLAAYAASFRDDFNRPRQAAWRGVYLRGLIQDGDRKSAEPMAARVPLPEGLDVSDPDQALQQFLGQGLK